MNRIEFERSIGFVKTPSGRIACVERGDGPVALFMHGGFLNGFQWRGLLSRCTTRRCIAFDLLAHGRTEIRGDQQVDFDAQAQATLELIDALGVDQVDIVASDTGGAVAQVLTAHHPERVRTLTLTNCDIHTQCPPPAFQPLIDLFRAGEGPKILRLLAEDLALAASEVGFGGSYQYPERLESSVLEAYLEPLVRTDETVANFSRFMSSIKPSYLVEIEPLLRRVEVPTLLAWGTADKAFDLSWARWLVETMPRGVATIREVPGAKAFWPEERPDELAGWLQAFWANPRGQS